MTCIMEYKNGLFIFRRDLRIEDNMALMEAHKHCDTVHTVFIFTPEQVGSKNAYRSLNAVRFMMESLNDLQKSIKRHKGHLNIYFGENEEIVGNLLNEFNIDAVYFNADVTPYAIKRDRIISKLCKKREIPCVACQDYYLYEPGTILSGSGNPYEKFTPFYNKVLPTKVSKPGRIQFRIANKKHSKLTIDSVKAQCGLELDDDDVNSEVLIKGGRAAALKILKDIDTFKHYGEDRNILMKPTTRLSAYIKFGNISIREVYHTICDSSAHGKRSDLLRQIIWRDFYAQLLFENPRVLGKSLKPKYDGLKWHKNRTQLKAWKMGKTGFPIVDAGMRELNTTGYMHNRARLITASFLIKTLLIDWREGEKYFASQLIDYDPASNNGNWQWVASTGADSQPYFRIFNPWSQSSSYDEEAKYIKQWVPELREVDASDIHQWDIHHSKYPSIKYVKPIVDYSEQRNKALEMYKAVV